MKNIHILPTDKPSNLVFEKLSNRFYTNSRRKSNTNNLQNQNIYITSDEKPKAGDWSLYHNKIHKCIEDIVGDDFKKIILTTDQDLIKDGVQAINDEFLEWFVKNPSCEEVTVYDGLFENRIWKKYIIIPKEEQKQHLIDMMRGDEELGIYWEGVEKSNYIMSIDPHDKQETLEEAALNYSKQFLSAEDSLPQCDFKKGAEWQAEDMIEKLEMHILVNEHDWNRNPQAQFRDFIEQFKKE